MAAVTGKESEQANFIVLANAVSALIGPAFVNKAQGLPLVVAEPFPDNSNAIKVPISGYLTASTLAESTAFDMTSANVEFTDTSVTCTAKKVVGGTALTVEALRFSQPGASLERMANGIGESIARVFDADLKTLFSSTTSSVIATSTLTKNNMLDARYNIEANMLGACSGYFVSMLDWKGVNELRKDLSDSNASAFGNLALLGLLGQVKPGNGYAGSIMGIDVYGTNGLPTASGDNVQQVWDPTAGFYAGVDGINGVRSAIQEPTAANGVSYYLLGWSFFKVIQWRDRAACIVRSDT